MLGSLRNLRLKYTEQVRILEKRVNAKSGSFKKFSVSLVFIKLCHCLCHEQRNQ